MSAEPGICRYCRCTEADPCKTESGDPCAWFNQERDVCTNDRCVAQYLIDQDCAAKRDFRQYLEKRRSSAAEREERRAQRRARRKKKAA